ncbi:cytochrome c oxidase copper chaperone [Gorgonomyces haynaldii]|nr:cytochrome c oxidase copper chaperone [Gorgonomyces haynaldii]
MGAEQSVPKEEPKCKPCCACPETRKPRDDCVFEKGEEACKDLIEAHQECMRKMGFKI